MNKIFVIAEHRGGELREITLQMLNKAGELCGPLSARLTLLVVGSDTETFCAQLANKADEIISITDERLETFDVDLYGQVISKLIDAQKPILTLLGHTPWGMDLAPVLSVHSGFPLGTDAVDILVEDNKPKLVRQIYSGKLFSKVGLKDAAGYLVTVRLGAFTPSEDGNHDGRVISQEVNDLPAAKKTFLGLVETGAGELDISQAEILVSIGRGVGDKENIAPIMELADYLGASVSCSRPIVDKNWLPKYHQVGTSGKSVKPKVYLALGISGAFQHVAGITGAGTIIAVNKDPLAPIFRFADFGVVEDLFKVVEELKQKMQ